MKEPNEPEQRRRTRVKHPGTAIIKSEGGMDKPKSSQNRSRKQSSDTAEDLTKVLSQKVVGQPAATRVIVPYIQMFQAGLAPEGRPVGVFLLLGPTGTGKTKTVEALAEVLHGSEKNVLKVDCGEFQMEHEVAKLIGAPPGYLGHRETQPMLTQQKLNSVTSEKCSLSLVLFDEIEKAAPSMTRLLLGVLDKATLRLGDNSTVNFEKSLVFLTSNLGAREMLREINPDFGFQSVKTAERTDLTSKLQAIALVSVRKRFSPEFVNRIDCIITYQPLTAESLSAILDKQIMDLQKHVNTRLGNRSFTLEVPFEARQFLLQKGTSSEYGARELNRTIHRYLTQPLATMVATNQVGPGARVRVDVAEDGASCRSAPRTRGRALPPTHGPAGGRQPRSAALSGAADGRCRVDAAHRRIGHRGQAPDAGTQAQRSAARLHAAGRQWRGIGGGVSADRAADAGDRDDRDDFAAEEEALCEEHGFPVLRKPFLASDVMNQIRSRLMPVAGEVRA